MIAVDFGDCFAYEVAREHECRLLFVGNDFTGTDIEGLLRASHVSPELLWSSPGDDPIGELRIALNWILPNGNRRFHAKIEAAPGNAEKSKSADARRQIKGMQSCWNGEQGELPL